MNLPLILVLICCAFFCLQFLCLFLRQFWHLEDYIVETFWCLMMMSTGTRPTDIKHIDSLSCGPMADWGQGTGEFCVEDKGQVPRPIWPNTGFVAGKIGWKGQFIRVFFDDFFCIEKWWTFKFLFYFFPISSAYQNIKVVYI